MQNNNSYKITKAKFKRIFAFFMAINIFFEVVSPTVAMALTSGPGQPEMASFEPVGTTDMVDVFTGDFNYNIPLLTVPGPNGGYPINIAYHSGIGIDDEASWVGLGWNINPGVITRNMRGLPDDFNGEAVTKKLNMRPNRTATLGFGLSFPEVCGYKIGIGFNHGMTWNNYKGFGYSSGLSISGKVNDNASMGVGMNYNSLSGETSLNPNISLTDETKKANNSFGLSANISSLNGLTDLNFTTRRQAGTRKIYGESFNGGLQLKKTINGSSNFASSTSFASSAFTPSAEFPSTGFNISTNFNLGLDLATVYTFFDVNASYSQTKYENNTYDFNAYGYLNSEKRGHLTSNSNDEVHSIMDFNREKDAALNKDIPSMPIPIATYDVYMVNGQGIGGVFRPYRTDIPLLADPAVFSENTGGSLGVELGLGVPTFNIGVNLAINYAKSYSGPWNDLLFWEDIYGKVNKGHAYFKQAGEMVADEVEETDFHMSSQFPIAVVGDWDDFNDVSLDPTEMAEIFSPIVEIRADLNGSIDKPYEDIAKTRSQLMSYKTFDEISSIPNYYHNFAEKSVYAINSNPLNTHNLSYPINLGSGLGSQIAEMSVINPDGNKYIYSLPAKNVVQKEVSFAIGGSNSPAEKVISYNSNDNSVNNSNPGSEDHFYASTEIPSYVHSYMLTAIVSPDYIDLKDDGLTDDDFGYWVKFNYSKTAGQYKWRMPFEGVNLLPGHMSADFDDKGGYTYGEKELWFLNSIETKTHIALFSLSNRLDAKGAANEDNTTIGGPVTTNNANIADDAVGSGQQKLDKITLYSKASPSNPIKQVNFTYNYNLCKETVNSIASGNGKLTLEKISFSYLNSSKGELSPYIFNYNENNPDENPNYGVMKGDCWGNYRSDLYGVGSNVFPYASQLEDYDGYGIAGNTKRNAHASAWNLKEITLPSGGVIKVDYEADDYAYVHDKKAMELCRIIGFGSDKDNLGNMSMEMTKNNKYLFFEIPNPSLVSGDGDVKKYTDGLSEIYFKVFTKLKNNGIEGIPKVDYVSGYAKINPNASGLVPNLYSESVDNPHPALTTRNMKVGYVEIVPVSISDVFTTGPKTHPFRKAGWQYLKLQRKDVLYPSSSALSSSTSGGLSFLIQAVNASIGQFTSSIQLFTGFYNYCETMGYCKEMVKNKYGSNFPSFIRLNNINGIKYGGGNRVKQIVISDTWEQTGTNNESESKYGQEYSYRLANGMSSGVAAYEPIIGGEEIPHHKPIRYSSDYFLLKNENLYMEEPVGESYYPAPSVGYSRITVKNIKQTENLNSSTEVTKTKEGITVYEFYTTKDFPYQIDHNGLAHEKFTPKIPIPFIGSVSFENHGFSQRINVTTNDMHGKSKSISTYAAGTDVNAPGNIPVTKIEYIYNTNSSGQLNNRVNVLFGDAFYREAPMGITEEKYIDNRQTFGIAMTQGMQTNVDWTLPYVVIPTFMPIINYSENLFKSIVNMKVTSQNGILMETKVFNEGSSVSTKNLLFDAYSGKPLLTSVTNDFEKPIYKYDYPAHWVYEGMGNAFKNDRATIIVSSGVIASNQNVFPGDELLINNQKVWVTPITTSSNFKTILEDGSLYSGSGTGLVIRSGRRNQQIVSNGSLVSLTNPVTERTYNLFKDYNNLASVANYQVFQSTDCGAPTNSSPLNFQINYDGAKTLTFISLVQEKPGCKIKIVFPENLPSNWNTLELRKAGKKALLVNSTTNTVLLTGDIYDECGLTECMDGVLNVAAYKFRDRNWEYDYIDAGNPNVNFSGGAPLSTLNLSTANPYRIGTEGIWRTENSWTYQTERKQNTMSSTTNTKIQDDGTFNQFVLFDWRNNFDSHSTSYVPNSNWTKVNEVTRYSPFGFEVENKNAIGIYTSALYGYNNSLQTAIANNAQLFETAFESFEDQGNVYTKNNGHIKLIPTSGNLSSLAHTGKKSLEITSGQSFSINIPTVYNSNYSFFQPPFDKKYIVSAWIKVPSGAKPLITLNGVNSPSVIQDGIVIEGWQKIEATFVSNSYATTQNIVFSITGATGNSYIDDIRIQPFSSTMKAFVYDPKTLWLVAELDNQNYATFYNYDEEGTLTQVKKETIKGIQTLKTSRSNVKIKQQP